MDCEIIVLLLALYCCATALCEASITRCGQVHITVSSLSDTYLELNWITDCGSPGDIRPEYILLYDKDIRDRNEESPPLVRIRASDYPHGYYRTKVKFGQPWLPGNWEYDESLIRADSGLQCFPYWIASLTSNEVIDSKCLGIQPTWMNDNRAQIGGQKIGSLFIPGTHNSGSYSGVPSFLKDYVLNQDRTVWTQLVFGIRYFDFRIGYYEHEGFFINHDLVRITRIEPIFQQIRKFVELAPKEVIIIDFHRFPYPSHFNATLHKKFVEFLHSELGDLALPPGGLQLGKGPTLNEIWAQNKSLILCYADRNIAKENYWLWQPVKQHWADTKNVNSLKNFLADAIKEHRIISNPMYVLMAELTPQPLDLILRINNLRQLANDVNGDITRWFRDEWSKDVNIVATDYFLGNDIINVAIDTNRNR